MAFIFIKNSFFLKTSLINSIQLIVLNLLLVFTGCSNKNDSKHVTTQTKNNIYKKFKYKFPEFVDSSFTLDCKNDSVILDTTYFNLDSDEDPNILTFRGGHQRNSPTRGKLYYYPRTIDKIWEFKTAVDSIQGPWGYWGGGAGWTGQPLVILWTGNELKQLRNLYNSNFNSHDTLIEIVQVSLSGYVYFINLKTGIPTRPPIYIQNPIKGTPSISYNKEFLFVGQGVPHHEGFYWRCFNLKTCNLIHKERMPSTFAYRSWGACDASPLISNQNTFFWPTESGVLYRGNFNKDTTLNILQYRYKIKNIHHQGIESSPAAIGNLMFFSDNGGGVFCIDINTMKPRWHFLNTDDSDASPVIGIESDTPYVYVGNEVDKQGSVGMAACRKLNGLNGKIQWEYTKTCYSLTDKKTNNGGVLSSVCVGKNKLQNFVWVIFSLTNTSGAGVLTCLNTKTGTVNYEIKMPYYSWSSPILIEDQKSNAYLYYSDVTGQIYIINAKDGKLLCNFKTGCIIESSPIAWNNYIVQPARGNKILCFKIN